MKSNLFKRVFNLKRSLTLDENEKAFVNFAVNRWGGTLGQSTNGEVLIDSMAYYPYMFKVAHVANWLAARNNLEIKTISSDYSASAKSRYMSKFTKFRKVYRSFGCVDGLDYVSLSKSELRECENSATLIMERVETKDDLLQVEFEGVRIGDLIYDSYLRVHNCATVELDDRKLLDLAKYALVIYRSCKNYFDGHKVKIIVLNHSIYIQYGILARVASARNIDVYLFPTRAQVVHKLIPSACLQTRNHHEYRERFLELDDKASRLLMAREAIGNRLKGVVDVGTSYMKQSAYGDASKSEERVFGDGDRTRVLVMLHCFFDSPHIYRDMIFPDFYEWLDFTLRIAGETNFDFYVKPHPNGLPGNAAIIEDFKKRYPKVTFIDGAISNNAIIAEGIDAAITVYGTIGHEFSYLGVPVVTAGDNPHSAYEFCNNPSNKAEYEDLIRHIDQLSIDCQKMEIEEFFYMHYLHPGRGRLEGNNDLFGTSTVARQDQDSDVLRLWVDDAEKGAFDDVEIKLEEAMSQL